MLTADVPATSGSSNFSLWLMELMATRTMQTEVCFSSPFFLPGFDEPASAGNYRVDHDEESIEGLEWLAWRRVGSFIHLPAIGARRSAHEVLPVDPADLDAALQKDHVK